MAETSDLARLVVSLEANVKGYERQLQRATALARSSMGEVQSSFGRGEKSVDSFLSKLSDVGSGIQNFQATVSRLSLGLGAALGAALSTQKLSEAADTYKRVMNSLIVAGVPAGELDNTFKTLFDSAQRNSVPLEALAGLYSKVSQAQQSLGVSSQQVIGLTETVAQALRVGGKSATEASGALTQLGQALSGNKVQAEEYNSLIDGLYPLLQAAAAGLTEAGGSVATLTSLVKEGEVSSKAFFAAIEAGSPILTDKLANAQDTVAQATTRLSNEFVLAIGEFDRLTGASGALAGALGTVSGSFLGVAQGAAAATNAIVGTIQAIRAMNAARAEGTGGAEGLDAKRARRERFDNELRSRRPAEINELLKESQQTAFDQDEFIRETNRAKARTDGRFAAPYAGPLPPSRGGAAVKPVSLKDPRFAAKDDEEGGGGGGGGRGGGAAKRANDFEREAAAVTKRTAALEQELSTLGRSKLEIEQAKTSFELLNAAKAAGIPITDELKSKVEELAGNYATTRVAVDETKAALQGQQELTRTVGQGITGYLSDIISGGENAQKALMNLTKRLADLALQGALLGEGPFGKMFGLSGSGGNVGGLFGMLLGGFKGLGSGGAAPTTGFSQLYHSGGDVGISAAPVRAVSTSLFAGAIRHHNGLGPGEYAAILERGERVMTRSQARRTDAVMRGLSEAREAGGSTGGGIVINNYGSAQVSAKRDSSGVTIVDVMDAVNARGASQAMRGRGPFAGMVDNRTAAQGRIG